MLATSLMTTTLIPAASTTLVFGPLAALAVLGIVVVGAVLIGGAIAEVRRQPRRWPRSRRVPVATWSTTPARP